jgi:3-phenylpropionate/trans-cinnamate dioxygenase ferredoxin reductase component
MSDQERYLIVGGGLAGANAAQTLREQEFHGAVVLIGEESARPYERPPLSKGYLQGGVQRDQIYVHPPGWYAEHDIELRLGTPAVALDPAAHQVALADGSRLDYTKLLLATGCEPRRLSLPGAEQDRVHYLRRLADSDRIRTTLRSAERVVLIGAGWIGLEVAAAARAAGVAVTVLESAQLPLLRVLGPEAAQVFSDLHRDHGVDLRCGAQPTEITGAGGAADGVLLGDGSHLAADAVIVGIGVTPNTGLARAGGLEVEDGVRVDARLQSSQPDIYAAGDLANAWHPVLGRHLRIEHWANALHQGQTAAKAMLGQDVIYDRLPYFYTDQYDLGMEYTGHVESGGYDRVVFRGEPASREFIAFWLDDDRVLAGMNVNVWDVDNSIGALVRSGKPVDVGLLTDPHVPLEALLEPAATSGPRPTG